jgi:hypothetical protein
MMKSVKNKNRFGLDGIKIKNQANFKLENGIIIFSDNGKEQLKYKLDWTRLKEQLS